ncbi:MAG: DISARM system phospholipase D-like protein DrmC [Nannocystaceae bacterium]
MIEAFVDLPLDVLERLQAGVNAGRLPAPLTETALRSERLPELLPLLPMLRALEGRAALEHFVTAVVVQRRRELRRSRPELVWTGPEPTRSRARRTSVVVQELLSSARREVFIAGYSFQGGEDLFDSLREGMVEHGVRVRIVIDCSGWKVYTPTSNEKILEAVTKRFWAKTWPHQGPRPQLYYDPRTLEREPPRWGAELFPPVSMHAKCIVVDRQDVLIGSANFTARAQALNLEVGLVLRDEGLADELLHQWQAAMAQQMILPV